MWYQRLFGDTEHFALRVELYEDDHPEVGQTALDAASWGRLELWINGRCLTGFTRAGESHQGVEWHLHHFWTWASARAVPLFNEEPFPSLTRRDEVASASDWLNESDEPPWSASEADEDRWYQRRSDWRARHALRESFPGAAAPHVLIRRLGDFIEFSWDNEAWPGARPDIRFTEQVGTARVGAARVAPVWRAFLSAFAAAVSERAGVSIGPSPAGPTADDWSWLVPDNAAAALRGDRRFDGIVRRLAQGAESAELVIPHTIETLLLRDAGALSRDELTALLVDLKPPSGQASETIEALRRPRPAPYRAPWKAGYAAALDVREALGWGHARIPTDFARWLGEQHIEVVGGRYSAAIDGVLVARDAHRPLIATNTPTADDERRGARLGARMAMATALGVYLLDVERGCDFGFVLGSAAHWPTLARAKAFGAMLLMPADGVEELFRERGVVQVRADDVRAVMACYGTTPTLTVNHLDNLGIIDHRARDALLGELLAG